MTDQIEVSGCSRAHWGIADCEECGLKAEYQGTASAVPCRTAEESVLDDLRIYIAAVMPKNPLLMLDDFRAARYAGGVKENEEHTGQGGLGGGTGTNVFKITWAHDPTFPVPYDVRRSSSIEVECRLNGFSVTMLVSAYDFPLCTQQREYIEERLKHYCLRDYAAGCRTVVCVYQAGRKA